MEISNLKEKIEKAKQCVEEESEFKREIFLAVLLKDILTEETTQSTQKKLEIKSHESKSKPLSIKEFLIEKKPKNDVERVLAMGYFLEKYQSYTSFNSDDLKDAFVKAKEQIPKNIHDKLYLNGRKGHITEYPEDKDNKKAYHLTATGEKIIEGGFKDE
ncbi:hypothetical protein J4204_04460 [Candidatus Woesearchaeota archaeon]|nr:hypothetical protein [Candidatus Woesearchaeota archaeon]